MSGAKMIVTIMRTRTIMEATARGFFMSFRMPSLKNVVDSLMTSCCLFSSSVAFSNLLTSICMLSGLFFGIVLSSIFSSGIYRKCSHPCSYL